MGRPSPPLNQSNAHPRSPEPWGRHAFEKGNSSRRVETAPRVCSDDSEMLRESGSGFVRHERECALPAVFLPVWKGTRWHRTGQRPGCMHFLLSRFCHWCYARSERSKRDSHRPELAEPALIPRLDGAAGGTALADSRQEGYAIPGGWLGVPPQPGIMEPPCVAASGSSEEMSALQSRVIDTLMEAWAPSTRRLYALKWGVFVKWCGQAHIDPATCTVSDVLSFLQYRLDSGLLPSTLKVYVAAITAFRSPQSGQSFGKTLWWWVFLREQKDYIAHVHL